MGHSPGIEHTDSYEATCTRGDPHGGPTAVPQPIVAITTKGREVHGGEELILRATAENYASVRWSGPGRFVSPEALNTVWYAPRLGTPVRISRSR